MKIIFILCISFFCIIHDALAVKITYVHTDALGSPVAETDESGNVKWTEHYTPFGKKIDEDPESSENTVGYTGHQFDSDTGLSYMQARYYDPVIGRFYSNDPVGFAGDITSFNRYSYVGNNPYKYTDPDGQVRKNIVRVLKDPIRSIGGAYKGAKRFLRDNGVIAPPAPQTEIMSDLNPDVPLGDDDPNQYSKRNKKEKNTDNPNKKKTSRGERNVKSDDPEQAKANEKADGNRRNRAKKDKQLKPKQPKKEEK